jgi:hypothetical protein
MDLAGEFAIYAEGSLKGQFAFKFSSRTQEGVDFFFLLILATQSSLLFELSNYLRSSSIIRSNSS